MARARNQDGGGSPGSDDSESSNNNRRKCQRWLHAGVTRDPKGNRVQMWFGFTHSRYQDATDARIGERGWHIHYAVSRNGELSGNKGVGQIQRNLITFNDHIASQWSRYLTRNGQWRYKKATKGREKQYVTLLKLWKNENYRDPYPNGNHNLRVGPSLNVIHPEGGVNDNPPYHAFDPTVRCYLNSRIPLSPQHIKFDSFTEWNASAFTVILEFLRGRMARAAGQANIPGFEALQVDRIESAFFYCGWRVDWRAVKKANKHVRENRVRFANNSRSWRRHRPIKIDPEQPHCDDVEVFMNDLRDNHHEPHNYGGDDSSDDDDPHSPNGGPRPPNVGPNGGQNGGANDSDSSDSSSDDEAPRQSRAKRPQKGKASTARAATAKATTTKTASGKGAKKAKGSGKNGENSKKPTGTAKAKGNAKGMGKAKVQGKGWAKKAYKSSERVVDLSSDPDSDYDSGSDSDTDEDHLSSYDENDDDDNHVLILDDSSEDDADDEDENSTEIIENNVRNKVGGYLQQQAQQQPRIPTADDEALFVSSDSDQSDHLFVEIRPVQSNKLGGSQVNSLKDMYFEQARSAPPVKAERSDSQPGSPKNENNQERQSPTASSAVIKKSTSEIGSDEAQCGTSESSGFQGAITDMLSTFGSSESQQEPDPQQEPEPQPEPQQDPEPQEEPEAQPGPQPGPQAQQQLESHTGDRTSNLRQPRTTSPERSVTQTTASQRSGNSEPRSFGSYLTRTPFRAPNAPSPSPVRANAPSIPVEQPLGRTLSQPSSPMQSPVRKRMSEEMDDAEETAEPQSPSKRARGDVKEEPIVIKDEVNGELIDLLSDSEDEDEDDEDEEDEDKDDGVEDDEDDDMVLDLDIEGEGTEQDPFLLD